MCSANFPVSNVHSMDSVRLSWDPLVGIRMCVSVCFVFCVCEFDSALRWYARIFLA